MYVPIQEQQGVSLYVVSDTKDYTKALRDLNSGSASIDDLDKHHYININEDYVTALRNSAML